MRYVTRPRSVFVMIDEFGDQSMTADEVFCAEDDSPQPTGLLDQHGNPIFRTTDRIKLGFLP